MSLARNETFKSTLETGLREAGLPSNPCEVVGRLYRFGCEHGSHHHVLSGIIQAVEVSDEGGLDLYVTNPRFWGDRLISIKHSNGKWIAYIDMGNRDANRFFDRFFDGEFKLL